VLGFFVLQLKVFLFMMKWWFLLFSL